MSALGQKQTSGQVRAMSGLPPKADIAECERALGPGPPQRMSALYQRGKLERGH